MPGEKLKLWTQSIKEYSAAKGIPYKVPKKGTPAYAAIKKIYVKKCK